MVDEFTEGERQVISYPEFKRGGAIEEGATISNIRPADLYTTQNWISPQKVKDALEREASADGRCLIPVYIGHIRGSGEEGRRVLVLQDGNTRAIIAWLRGTPLDGVFNGPLPEDKEYISLGLLRRKYQDLFTGFEYR